MMPTILFDDNFTAKEKVILMKTFKANCERLGITRYDCTVTVRREDIGRKSKQGAMTRVGPDHFLVLLNSNNFNLFEGISVLGHEMVHVHQYLRGDLTDSYAGCHWRGQVFPSLVCEILYEDLPWEKEAFGLQPALHKHAVDTLSREEGKYVVEVSRFAFP